MRGHASSLFPVEIVDDRLRFPVPEGMMPWQKDEMERFGFVEVDGYFYTMKIFNIGVTLASFVVGKRISIMCG